MRPIFFMPLREPRRGQLLAIPAFLHKRPLQRRDLPVQQEIRLVDQADESIRPGGRVFGTLRTALTSGLSIAHCGRRRCRR